ncbi:MAG: hypothetical protein QMD14_01485 [Candidatus Aenigmarchaeota archaeon]|nr:hypothetical protein [Candidatus Aenigmarchaeota archaeon]
MRQKAIIIRESPTNCFELVYRFNGNNTVFGIILIDKEKGAAYVNNSYYSQFREETKRELNLFKTMHKIKTLKIYSYEEEMII